jgi:hypothetical protein
MFKVCDRKRQELGVLRAIVLKEFHALYKSNNDLEIRKGVEFQDFKSLAI